MLHRRIGLAALMAGTVALAACNDSSPTTPPDAPQQPTMPAAPTAERLVIEPGSILLPGAGTSVELQAVAYDAAGAEVEVESIIWTSMAPEFVTVSTDGLATAVGPLGSATLVARAGTLESEPVQALVAVPADDAVLVPDASFTGMPEAEDPDAVYGLGWRYRVPVAADVAVEPGQIMLASGEMPVGGRVVSVAPGTGGNIVTLELVSPAEMFDDLVFERRIDLRDAELIIPEDVEQGFEVLRLPDGGLRFEGRDGWAPAAPARLPGQSGPAAASGDFPLGPFLCKVEGDHPLPTLPVGPTFRLLPSFDYEVAYDSGTGGLQRLILEGDLEVEAEAGATLEVATGGKVSCSRRLASIRIPFPGPLGLFFGGRVDVKAGFEASGSLTLAGVGFNVEGAAHAGGRLGVACTVGCGMVRELDVGLVEDSFDAELTGSILGVTEPFHVNLKASVFGKAVLRIGHPFIDLLQAELVEFSAGPAQKFDLATPLAQAQASDYRSTFGAVLTLSAGPAADVEDVIRRFGFSVLDPSVDVEIPLSGSPRGTFSITPDRVAPGNTSALGETATFTVVLDPTTYLGAYSVEAVHIMWLRENEQGEPDLFNGRPACTTIPASPGQTVFTCTTDFTEDHLGEQTFVAFVEAKLFGVPFPLFLEVADDGRETVVVGEDDPLLVVTSVRVAASAGVYGSTVAVDTETSESRNPDAQDQRESQALEEAGSVTASANSGSFTHFHPSFLGIDLLITGQASASGSASATPLGAGVEFSYSGTASTSGTATITGEENGESIPDAQVAASVEASASSGGGFSFRVTVPMDYEYGTTGDIVLTLSGGQRPTISLTGSGGGRLEPGLYNVGAVVGTGETPARASWWVDGSPESNTLSDEFTVTRSATASFVLQPAPE